MYRLIPIQTVERDAAPADRAALLALYHQCADFLALGPLPASAAMVNGDLTHSRSQGGVYCGIFSAGDALLGVADFIPSGYDGDPSLAFFELLMIAPGARGRGLGAWAADQVEQAARQAGADQIQAAVQVNNPRAAAFWERLGYRPIAPAALQPDGTVTVLLVKRLRERS